MNFFWRYSGPRDSVIVITRFPTALRAKITITHVSVLARIAKYYDNTRSQCAFFARQIKADSVIGVKRM